jgi:hypothetical protein
MGLPKPLPPSPEAHTEELDTSTFSHSDRNMHVTVEKPEEGCMCTLSMVARVPLAPDRLYELLIDPKECMRIFKSLKRVRHRRVLADDGKGNRTVEVDQTGAWRFLIFRGSFTVRMIVEQRASDRTISFRLAKPGFMRQFSGTWTIAPYDNASLDEIVNRHRPSALHRLQSSLRSLEHTLGLVGQQDASLVQLQQSVAPAFTPPASVARMLQRIAAKQIEKIMSDLQAEVQRMNSGSKSSSGSSKSGGGGGSKQAAEEQQAAQRDKGRGKAGQQAATNKKQLVAHVSQLR